MHSRVIRFQYSIWIERSNNPRGIKLTYVQSISRHTRRVVSRVVSLFHSFRDGNGSELYGIELFTLQAPASFCCEIISVIEPCSVFYNVQSQIYHRKQRAKYVEQQPEVAERQYQICCWIWLELMVVGKLRSLWRVCPIVNWFISCFRTGVREQ